MSIETMTKLSTVTVGSGGQSTIEFTNIPQGYTDLVLTASIRPSALDDMFVKFNNSTSSFTGKRLNANGSSASSDSSLYWMTPQVATSNTFSSFQMTIFDYSSSAYKIFSTDGMSENNGSTAYMSVSSGLWSNPSPVTSITLYLSAESFVEGSTAAIYGVKAARTAMGNSLKAMGGNISYDGTYVYHAFTSTGTFAPSQPVTAEVLVVAGGGGGGYYYAGGGGAGGVCHQLRRTLTPGSSYAITVGAAGTSAGTTIGYGGDGTNSTFDTITAIGGGGGGYWNGSGYNGRAGGSGGGGGMGTSNGNTTSGGAATQTDSGGATGYGNAGGGGRRDPFLGGGGGGAGAAGSSASGTVAGSGGDGLSIWSAWTSVSGMKTFGYIAGGGGGGQEAGSGGGTGGLGGGGTGGDWDTLTAATAGKANTGSGGGGSGGQTAAAAGGSGIVIVRYKA